MTVKFMTVKGSENLGHAPFYVGIPQHERTMSRREAYEYLSQQTGFKPAQIRAAFLGLANGVHGDRRRRRNARSWHLPERLGRTAA